MRRVMIDASLFYKKMIEKTLVIFKPDAMQRGLVGEGLARFERRGLKIVGLKMMQLDEKILREHYAHVADLPFFPTLQEFMQSTPVVIAAIEGPNAVEAVRKTAGIEASDIGTFRGDLMGFTSPGQLKKNLIHSSDSSENAVNEIMRFFQKNELFEWKTRAWKPMFSVGEWKE
jgi:nucleoside-diphosphate kinase